MDDGLNEGNTRVARQCGEARPDNGLAGDLPILLGHISARPQPATACHDDGCDTRSHVLSHSQMMVGHGFSASRPRRKWRWRQLHLDCDFCTAALAHSALLAKLYAAGEHRLFR